MKKRYAIQFNFPEGLAYAGEYKGAAGWAPTVKTAWVFDDSDTARRTLNNAYGASAKYGRIVEIDEPHTV